MSSLSTAVSVVATITAKEGRADEIIKAFENAKEAVQAEDGTLVYALHRSQTSPNTFYVTELYRDQAALDAHLSGEAIKAMTGIGDAIEGFDMQFANPVSVAKGM